MNVIEVLLLAWSAGLVLERRESQLIVNGADREEVHPDLLKLLQQHKPEILAVLTDRVLERQSPGGVA